MNEHQSMDQVLLDTLNDTIETNLQNEQFGVTDLARESGLSQSQLNRRLNALTGQSASQMIRECRLKKAMELLEDNAAKASEVAYLVSFGSPTYFSTCFHNFYGYPPGDVKNRKSSHKKRDRLYSKKVVLIFVSVMILMVLAYYSYRIISTTSTTRENKSLIQDKTIAVLAFDDMSPKGDQEYFCDGISEEIINNLAQIKELKVIGRSSSFQFKGQNPDHREIGKKLQVSTFLEGAIRKSGDNIRITAQLINVADGSHIWSQTFDRDLVDIFKIQDEISEAIADKLKVSLGLHKQTPVDLEIYDLYLRARIHLHERGTGVELSIKLFEQILEKDSTYQPAWRGLAQAWIVIPLFTTVDSLRGNNNRKVSWTNAEKAVQKALLLNPIDAEGLAAKATILNLERKYSDAYEYYRKAIKINDHSAVILEDYVQFLLQMGYAQKAMPNAQKMIGLDPLTPLYLLTYSKALVANGLTQECIQALKKAIVINPNVYFPIRSLVWTYLNIKQIDSALYVLESYSLAKDVHADYKDQIVAVKKSKSDFAFGLKNRLAFAMNELNQQDTMLNAILRRSKTTLTGFGYDPIYAPQGLIYHSERFISDPRMKEAIRNSGLVEFWQEHG